MKKLYVVWGVLLVLFSIVVLVDDVSAKIASSYSYDKNAIREVDELALDNMPTGGWSPMEGYKVEKDVEVEKPKISRSRNTYNASLDNVFTKGAGTVGYNALSKDSQKNFYLQMNTASVNFMQSTEDLHTTKITTSSGDIDVYVVAQLNYSALGLKEDEAIQAFFAYDYDHPGYYWIGNYYYWSDTDIYLCTEKEYASVSNRSRINARIINGVKQYATLVGGADSVFNKIAIIHDKIVTDVDYAYEADGTTPVSKKWAHSVQGVFDSDYSEVVCEGYADTFSFMMNYLDIPNYYIVGTARGEGHAWNAVSDDGGLSYMYMDLTWDDKGKEKGFYNYFFGMPASDFESNHVANVPTNTKSQWLYKINGKFYNDLEHTYYYKAGYYCSASDDYEDFAQSIRSRVYSFGNVFSYLSDDENIGDNIATELDINNYLWYKFNYLNKQYYLVIVNENTHVDISDADVVLETDRYDYTGEEIRPEIESVTINGLELVENVDYTVSYDNNIEPGEETASVVLEGIGHFEGTCCKEFSIDMYSFNEADVSLSSEEFIYDGTVKKPVVTVTYGDGTLVEDENYTVEYSDDVINAGTVTITINGKGKYQGTIEKEYIINPISIDGYELCIKHEDWLYDGTPKTPDVISLKDGDNVIDTDNYTVTYENNVNAGINARVIVTGCGNYTGSCVELFSIQSLDICEAEYVLSQTEYIYTGEEYRPDVTLTCCGNNLEEGFDYMIDYASNVSTAGIKKINIYGIKNYTGMLSDIEYTITPKEVSITGITAKDKIYDGTTDVSLDYSGVDLIKCGILEGDSVDLMAEGLFDDADACVDKTVVISNITISGEDAANYKLSETGQQKITSADIIPKSVTITALDQTVYLDDDIDRTVGKAVLVGALENHELTGITFSGDGTDILIDNGSIIPWGATIKNGGDDVTSNYDINYISGILTVINREYSFTYTWSDDCKKCAAKAVSSDSKIVEEEVETTGEVTKEATCKDKGITTYTAIFTHKLFSIQTKEVSDIDRISTHTASDKVVENVVDATCLEVGSQDEVVYCSVCGTELSRDKKTVDALGHDWSEWTVTTPATEDAKGEETRTCKRKGCGKTETREIPQLVHTHDLIKHDAQASTCEAEGNIEYWECKGCGKLFADEAGNNEISSDAVVETKKDHVSSEAVKEKEIAAGCESDGSYEEVVYCSECGAELSRENKTVDALGHDWSEWKVTTPATEDAKGEETRTCKRKGCGKTETREIPKLAHTHDLIKHDAQASTCEAEGNIEYWECKGCGKLFADEAGNNEISSDEVVETKKDHVSSEAVKEKEIAAGCESDGSYEEVVYCSECGAELSREKKTVVACTDHKWDSGVVTKVTTATEDGIKTYTCEVCHITKTEIIAKKGNMTSSNNGSDTKEHNTTSQQSDSQQTPASITSSQHTPVQSTDSQQTTVQPSDSQSTSVEQTDKQTDNLTTFNIQNKKTYKKSKKITIKDLDGIKSISLNGKRIKSGKKKISFKLSKYKKYLKKKIGWNKLVIVDANGNVAKIQFKVK